MKKPEDPKVLFIVGPTGSGKSAFAFKLAKKLRGEIISADSMQVYKGMDIGTDKPSRWIRRQIPHHLLDCIDVSREFSVYEYRERALSAVKRILKKGKLPIVAGGTGLYVKALVDGFSPQPGKNEEVRNRLAAEAREKGLDYLYRKVQEKDPVVAGRVHPHDEKRIIRALEVLEISGKRLSDWEKETVSLAYRFWMIGIQLERDEIYRRINERVDAMFKKGLVKEARRIFFRQLSLTARQAIGYSELFDYFEGKMSLEEAREKIKQYTRNFAKRQLTWFRRDSRIRWLKNADAAGVREVAAMIKNSHEN